MYLLPGDKMFAKMLPVRDRDVKMEFVHAIFLMWIFSRENCEEDII